MLDLTAIEKAHKFLSDSLSALKDKSFIDKLTPPNNFIPSAQALFKTLNSHTN